MQVLELLFGCFVTVVGVALYSNGFLHRTLAWLNHRYLVFCESSLNKTDDELIKTLKPVVFGFSIFLLLLASVLLQWWGEDDMDVQQLSFTWIGVTAFSGLVLIPRQEFGRRVKEIINMLTSTAKWSYFSLAGIIVLMLIVFTAFGKTVTSEELKEVIIFYSTSFAAGLILFAVILFAAIISLPYILQKLFILNVRKVIDFTLKKDRTNPIGVPMLFTSIIFAVISVISLLVEKLL